MFNYKRKEFGIYELKFSIYSLDDAENSAIID